jgi:pimeloyl-ACP methyl ester carboxylesterase
VKRWVLVLCCLEATASFAEDPAPPSFAERKAAMDPLSRRFLRPNDDVRPLPAIAGFSPRPVEFDDPSGATLRGALYDRPDTNRVVVLCLGIRGNHTYLLPYARIVIEAGYDALLFDYRGFGSSDGVASAFSLRGDVLAAIDFAVADGPRSKDDIAIFGLSLGSVLALVTWRR